MISFDEEDWFRRFSAGNPAALRELVMAYFPILCRFAEKYVPDSSLAKDIVQETFIKLWQYEKPFESCGGLKSFLFIATRNGCLNLLRGRAREEEKHTRGALTDALTNSTDIGSLYDEITRLEQLGRINQVAQQLPPKMQAVFMLSFREGLSIPEIAARLNISVKTVRNQRYKSLVILRNAFHGSKPSLILLIAFLSR